MLKRSVITAFCVGCCLAASAQNDVELLKKQYEANKRDVKAVKEYVEALGNAKMRQEAERVIREYMARCPVLQIEDKDTYLLLSKYVFSDPYSNVFEYGIYAAKKMKWDRTDSEDRSAWLNNLLKKANSVVGNEEEVDKRYEALSVLSRNLKKEVDKLCEPCGENGHYILPPFDSVKVAHLSYLVNKGDLFNQDEMRLKLAVAKALHGKQYDQVIQSLEMIVNMNLMELKGSYLLAVLSVLADESLEVVQVNKMLSFALQLTAWGKASGDGTNYYGLLAELYALSGDHENAKKYDKLCKDMEAECMKRYKDLFNMFQGN